MFKKNIHPHKYLTTNLLLKKVLLLFLALIVSTNVWLNTTSSSHAQDNPPQTTETCSNLLVNGNLENDAGWSLDSGEFPAQYVPLAYSGNQSLSLGPSEDQSLFGPAWSIAWQMVDLPADSAINFSFRYRFESQPDPGNDRYYVALLDDRGQVIKTFFDSLEQGEGWNFFSDEVTLDTALVGQIYLGLENDGLGGNTQLLIDELVLCTQSRPADVPSQTNTPQTDTPLLTTSVITSEVTDPTDRQALINFGLLGFEEVILEAPAAPQRLRFNLPVDWQPTEGVTLQLELSTIMGGSSDLADTSLMTGLGGILEIKFNNILLDTIPLDHNGEYSLSFPIPSEALAATDEIGRHRLDVALISNIGCNSDRHLSVIIHPTSNLVLPYQLISPPTNLSLLPKPIFQGSFITDTATIVVPTQPTLDELSAALTVAAGFGEMTRNELSLSLTTEEQLTSEARKASHLIFVGDSDSFSSLNQTALPSSIQELTSEADGAEPDDGIIRMVVSPWNSSKVILFVGGASDKATLKAAQALSTGTIRESKQPNLAVIAEVSRIYPQSDPEIATKTFAGLGYEVEQVTGQGMSFINFLFHIPPGYTKDAEESYLDLVFNHSALLDYEQSGLNIILNGKRIASSSLSAESTNITETRITIPRGTINPGVNELQMQVALESTADCLEPEKNQDLWFTVWPETVLHLPLIPIEQEPRLTSELQEYPFPFSLEPTLHNTRFVVPKDDPIAWHMAAQIASNLGYLSDTPLIQFEAMYGDAVSEIMDQPRHLIIVGRPSTLPIIEELGDNMPAPFVRGSDVADERDMRVRYRILPGMSLGYLQLFAAPWDPSKSILTVLGSTSEGLQWATMALVSTGTRNQLESNLAVINHEQIMTGEPQPIPQTQAQIQNSASVTLTNPITDSIETTTASETNESLETITQNNDSPTETVIIFNQEPRAVEQPSWMLPLLAGSVIAMFLIVIGITINSWRQRSTKRTLRQS